ncbi:MAG: HAMP domain-containing protein [Polyangiaceae bacterium]|nr:HAMP domain-containing protein [Polyangiaceae bacterium]
MNLARKRLTRKLLAIFTAPVAVGFLVAGFVSIRTTRDALLDASERALVDNIATLRNAALPFVNKADLQGLVERVAAEETVQGVALYDEHGELLACSSELATNLSSVNDAAKNARKSGTSVEAVVHVAGRDVLLHAEPFQTTAGISVVAMTHELAPALRMANVAMVRLALTGGTVAVVVSIIAFWISRVLGRDWGNLVHAADRVAAGDLDVRVEASHRLEIDRVARAFNDMTRALSEAREALLVAEAERLELDARIRHAQALAVVGQVAGSFAHEIGSPLNTILGWSRLSASDESLSEPIRLQFETIASQCERITRIVQRMLSVARPPADQRASVNLADVVREVTAFLAPDLRIRRIDLRVLVAASLPPIVGVRDHFLQVVMNLCVNAIQAQPGGGVLRITLALEEAESKADSRICLEVADAGPGVPDEDRGRIFELFFSTKAKAGGTGLGLPIVSDIVRDLGGSIEVATAPEGGALFRVRLPIIEAE